MKNLNSFEQLDAWQIAQELAVEVYKLTKTFPDEEKFGLINQVRRSSVSISANIAEGFGRGNTSEKVQFYRIAYGSLLETKSFIYLANKLNYMDNDQTDILLNLAITEQKLINALIRSVKKRA